MLKKTITYTDYNGTQRTEDYYFHLSRADLIEMQVEADGNFADDIRAMVDKGDEKEIYKFIKMLITKSYGVKSADGRYFDNDNPEEARKFFKSEAYSALLMELTSDADKAAAFFNGIIPADLAKEAVAEVEKMNK